NKLLAMPSASCDSNHGKNISLNQRSVWVLNLVVAEQHVGHVLAHSPHDPNDTAWPHRGVRDIREELDNEQIERGIITERSSMRGPYWKAIHEGGRQERELVGQYRAWENATLRWPRTSALLQRIAAWWDREAANADIRARQDKMRE
ncbi:MAG: hypothetical protein ACRECZ_00435, partial [Methylocella sp.]